MTLTDLYRLAGEATPQGKWTNTHIFDGEEVITGMEFAVKSWEIVDVATARNHRTANFIAACSPKVITALAKAALALPQAIAAWEDVSERGKINGKQCEAIMSGKRALADLKAAGVTPEQ